MTTKEYESYYVPAQSKWPIVGAIALFLIAVGAGNYVANLNNPEVMVAAGYYLLVSP